MRVQVFQYGTLGDVRPLVAIGAGLRSHGHEVTVLVNPRFERLVRDAGLGFEPVGTVDDYVAVLENPDLWHARRGPRMLQEAVFGTQLARQIEAIERGRPDVVVGGTFAVGAQLACEKTGVPFVRVHGQPSIFFGAHDPPVLPSGTKPGGPLWFRRMLIGLLDRTVMKSTVGRALNAERTRLGLPLWTRDFMGAYAAADLNLCLFPDWFAAPTPDWPDNVRQLDFPLVASNQDVGPELAAFLEEGDAPVVFTPGPAGYQHSDAFFVAAADACTLAGRRGVFVTRGIELGAAPAKDILVCEYAPFDRLFPAASVLVHHGGIGTVARGLAAGRPQVITPFGFDQPDNAARLSALGVGAAVPRRRANGAALAAAIARVDDAVTRERSARLSRRVGGAGIEQAVSAIDALAGSAAEGRATR